MKNWQIKIKDFNGGYAPSYWKNDYPAFGNSNMAGDMLNVDLTDPNGITQGPALTAFSASGITTLLRGISDHAVSDDVTYGIGGTKLYKLGQSAIVEDANFPHEITGAVGEDVALYKNDIYYTYNTSSSGVVGVYDTSAGTFNDTLNQSLEFNVPHPCVVAGTDGVLAIGNGHQLTTYDGTTWTLDDFDIKDTDSVIVSVVWNQNRFHIAANKPYITTGTNKMLGSIYIWNGASTSWETRAEVKGEIGALYVKDGTTFVFYKTDLKNGVCNLGVLDGNIVRPLPGGTWQGDLPKYYQVGEYNGFIIWISGNKVMAYGSNDPLLPARLFNLTTLTYATGGGITTAFADPIIASTDNTTYEIAKFSGYKTDGYWRGLLIDLRGGERIGKIEMIRVNFDQLTTGAGVTLKLVSNKGTTLWTGTISYTDDGAVTKKDFHAGIQAENGRLEISWSNGSATAPVKIRSIYLFGHTEK